MGSGAAAVTFSDGRNVGSRGLAQPPSLPPVLSYGGGSLLPQVPSEASPCNPSARERGRLSTPMRQCHHPPPPLPS
eukprot:1026607-Pyramimonas_sp.AAC.1